MAVLLEICVDSLQSAVAARSGGADRLEVCGDLMTGGTTPSIGLVQRCVEEVGLPVMMMIRPHAGGFVYSSTDLATMKADISAAKAAGVAGVVFGALTEQHTVDVDHCEQLMQAAHGMETTFHRAFDIVSDPVQALRQIQDLGFRRLLTSGQQSSAFDGARLIAQLVATKTNVEIIAGAGVNAENVAELIRRTGVSEVHASASEVLFDGGVTEPVAFHARRMMTQVQRVADIKRELLRDDSL